MLNEEIFVNPGKVAKQAKNVGEFMMMKCSSGNLLVTGQFILNLTADQFWSVQCKLELPEYNAWYMQTKEGLTKSERKPELDEWERRYNEWLTQTDPDSIMKWTLLNVQDCYLYTDGRNYTAVKHERIDMLNYPENIIKSGKMVVFDEINIVAPVNDIVWSKNDWIRKLPGMGKESEEYK